MLTELDAGIVDWVGRLGAAGAEHVMRRMEMGRSWAYHRLGALTADGLLAQQIVLYRRPGLYLATRAGLRWRDLAQLGACRVGPGAFEHAWQVAEAAVALHEHLAGWQTISDREIRAVESTGAMFASARVGEGLGGRPALHRPDLALISPTGRVLAVEVELSIKAPRRLQAICRGWARARHLDGVYYLAAPPAARAVQRAIDEVHAQDKITVLALDDTAALAAAEERAAR